MTFEIYKRNGDEYQAFIVGAGYHACLTRSRERMKEYLTRKFEKEHSGDGPGLEAFNAKVERDLPQANEYPTKPVRITV